MGCDDEAIATLSKEINAPILTLDKDFGRIYYFKDKVTIFLIRVKPPTPRNIIKILEKYLERYSFKNFKGCLVIIQISKLRMICGK